MKLLLLAFGWAWVGLGLWFVVWEALRAATTIRALWAARRPRSPGLPEGAPMIDRMSWTGLPARAEGGRPDADFRSRPTRM